MKHYLRILSLVVCLCMLTASLSSCLIFTRIANVMGKMEEEYYANATETGSETQESSAENESPYFTFTLTEQDKKDFDEQLYYCEVLTMDGKDIPAIAQAWTALEEMYYHIATQSQIAYILYCCDQEDETASDNYLFASEMASETYSDYMELCQKIDASDSPYRETFFSDWTEEELDVMRGYSDEFTAIHQENDQILVDYRALDETQFTDEACNFYLQLVKNNNKLAQKLGFSNYYEYAYKDVYLRDYGKTQMTFLRGSIAPALVTLCKDAYQAFDSGFQQLSTRKQRQISNFLYSDYDDLSKDYLMDYIESLEGNAGEDMRMLFEPGNAIFTDSANAYAGAFTGTLYEYEAAVCYFGPGYQSSLTVAHELGHYYAAQYSFDEELMLDLAETQSQGNEWLLLQHMEDLMDADVYEVLINYQIYMGAVNILLCVIIDEFEQKVYENANAITDPETQLDAFMTQVCERYGGVDFVMEYITDPYVYWRYVTIESPVYYISYAVSGIAAMNLYAMAKTDESAARECYRNLVEHVTPEDGFLGNLKNAGLDSPFSVKALGLLQSLV